MPRIYTRRTHCPHGHAYEGDNVFLTPTGAQGCRECRRLRKRAARAQNRTPRQPRPRTPTIERLLARIEIGANGCWVWRGYTLAREKAYDGGYGSIGHVLADGSTRTVLTHRFAYEHFVGPIPQGLELDHLCRNRACCNPDHLEPVTRQENADRGLRRKGFAEGVITHCRRGHAFTPENTLVHRDGERECRACARARKRAWASQKRAAERARLEVGR